MKVREERSRSYCLNVKSNFNNACLPGGRICKQKPIATVFVLFEQQFLAQSKLSLIMMKYICIWLSILLANNTYCQIDTIKVEGLPQYLFCFIRPSKHQVVESYIIPGYYRNMCDATSYYHCENGKFNGEFRKYSDENVLLESGYFTNGMKQGEFKEWNCDGILVSIINYKNGVKHGEFKVMSQRGYLIYECRYSYNKITGKAIDYYPNGQRAVEKHYSKGKIIDSIYYWYSDGRKLKAVYNGESFYYASFEKTFGIGVVLFQRERDRYPFPHRRNGYAQRKWDTYLYDTPRGKRKQKLNPYRGTSSLQDVGSVYICFQKLKRWYQIETSTNITSNEVMNLQKFWVSKRALDKVKRKGFLTWQEYLKNDLYIDINDIKTNPILADSIEGSDTLKCQFSSCLISMDATGDWMKVYISLGDDCSESLYLGAETEEEMKEQIYKKCFEYGWIKWRDDKKFLITFQEI